MEKKSHRLTVTEACKTFLADPVKGLTSGEAGARHKSKAEIAGGVILIVMGVKILIETSVPKRSTYL